MIKTKELRGLQSVWALNAYSTLVYGLATEQACLGQDYETSTAKFEALPLADKEKQLRHALQIVNLSKDDMQNLLAFALDVNGIPYSQKNVDKLPPMELVEAMLAVCLELAQLRPQICPEDAKKNLNPAA